MRIEDKIHLEFIHNRLIDIYKESRNIDFVKKLRDIINNGDEESPSSSISRYICSKKTNYNECNEVQISADCKLCAFLTNVNDC